MKYIKLFESFETKEIDLTDQYKSGNITHKAKVGEVIEIRKPDTSWIKGEVFLTKDMIGYHGGLINNIDEYMNKTALYLTRSMYSTLTWNIKGLPYTRVYEVKIKNGSKFIGCSPAGQNHDGLNDEKMTLVPMGIVGMSDKNFKNNTHTGTGTAGSEGLILDRSAIVEFRVIPFKELIQNEKVKKHLGDKYYKNFVEWYHQLKEQIFYTMEEYKEYEKSLGEVDIFSSLNYEIDFNSIPKISDKIDQTIENMDTEKLKAFIKSLVDQRKIYNSMFSGVA
jgi:hypothetical protein